MEKVNLEAYRCEECKSTYFTERAAIKCEKQCKCLHKKKEIFIKNGRIKEVCVYCGKSLRYFCGDKLSEILNNSLWRDEKKTDSLEYQKEWEEKDLKF